MGKIIGIDLGTTNSCVAVMEGNNPSVIINSEGKNTTPSVVAFTERDERKVGDPAKRQGVTNPGGTVYSIKRFMGKKYDEVTKEIECFPYVVERSSNGGCQVSINGKKYTPQEISAMILQKMKKTAEDFIGQTVTEAVITVPAYFNDTERQATKEAGMIAGLDVKRIINEPTAAALAYGLDKKKNNEKIAVFDLGGGTFDISILELSDGVFEVKATNGDVHLGGDNFDERIIDWLIEEFRQGSGIDLRKDAKALQRLKDDAEKAKIALSNSISTEISLPYIAYDATGTPMHIDKTLTRAKFESLCDDLFAKCLEPCRKCLSDSGFSVREIDEVVLVGGSTRIPKVQSMVKDFFGREPNKGVNPDEVVAVGAAIQGGVLTGEVKDVLLLDVTPLSLGIETKGGVFTKLIEANTTIPTKKSEVFSTAENNQTAVTIHVLQGERPMAKDNKSLGQFNLDGIPAAPQGVPQIEVSFDIDANGILNVSAREKNTGKVQTIRIDGSSNLSKEDIERMKKDAEMHAQEDQRKREFAEKINDADNIIFQTEKQLKEYGDKIPGETKKKIEEELEELKKAKEEKDISKIDAAKNKLMQDVQAIYQTMQQQQSSGGNSSAGAHQGATDGNNNAAEAKEASFEEVK